MGKGLDAGFLLAKHLVSGAQGGFQSLGRAWVARMLMLGSKDPFHRDIWPLTPGDVTRVASIPPCGIAVWEQESKAWGRVFRGTGGRWPGPARGQGAAHPGPSRWPHCQLESTSEPQSAWQLPAGCGPSSRAGGGPDCGLWARESQPLSNKAFTGPLPSCIWGTGGGELAADLQLYPPVRRKDGGKA